MVDWPADHVERREIESLIDYAKNARTHSDAQIAQIARSIEQFGFAMPVLIDEDGTLIAGHARVRAARLLGLLSVPVMIARGWSDEQKAAYVLADNKLSLNAGWDDALLKGELGDLKLAGWDLALTGFSDLELGHIFAEKTPGLTDPDAVPAAPALAASRLGDAWRMGRHTLYCADAASADMDDPLAVLCVTSPPYADKRDYQSAIKDWNALMVRVFAHLPVTREAQVLVNLGLAHHDNEWVPYWDDWIYWMRERGWRRFGWYVWDQGYGLPGAWNGRLAPSHEFVFHFNQVAVKPRKIVPKQPESIALPHATTPRGKDGTRAAHGSPKSSLQTHKIPDSVFRVERHHGRGVDHPAVGSAALFREMIEGFSDPGDQVVDPFAGSGTTIIAAEMTGRCCTAIEISPVYCDIAVRRWEEFTGKTAILEETGETFDQTAQGRRQTAGADAGA